MENLIITEKLPLSKKQLLLLDAVFPKEELVSREAKRLYQFESAKAMEDLSNVNDEFIGELFSDDFLYMEYQVIYAHHLKWWTGICQWYHLYGKLRYVKINEDWFADNYRPLETPTAEWDY